MKRVSLKLQIISDKSSNQQYNIKQVFTLAHLDNKR